MDPEFWHERWRLNQIGFHQREINTHLQAFWERLKLPVGSRIFVPLCGKSRDMLWLRAHGHPILGVELSEIAVRDFFAENGLHPRVSRRGSFAVWESDGITLLCGNFFDLTAADLDDCIGIYDRASLIALPPEMRKGYVQHLQAVLSPLIVILLVSMEYPEGMMQGPPFTVPEPEIRALYASHFILERLYRLDVLTENLSLREKGLSTLVETIYRLRWRTGAKTSENSVAGEETHNRPSKPQ